ncbi:MAG: aminotransferase class I/II-fold pyridoxal phosphate-dependent enzyme [Actinomycetes bacterium]
MSAPQDPNNRHNVFANLDTAVVQAGRPPVTPDGPVNPPIVLSSTMHAGGEHGYMRDWNATLDALEQALGVLDGGKCTVFSSGMAAANAVFDLFPQGSVVVASQFSYTGVTVRLNELHALGRIQLRLVDITDDVAVEKAISGEGIPANWVWIETPTNPMMEICDIEATAAVARKFGAYVVVDSTFMTPIRQRPLELGAHVVMHSATKGIAGHSDLLMGALVTQDEALAAKIIDRRVLLGAVPSAFDSYLALRGLRTLAVRVDKAESNAQFIAERLANHSKVSAVYYPGLGGHKNADVAKRQTDGPGFMLSFLVDGDAQDAERVCQAIELITYATSLGGVETLMERRRRWPSENVAVPENLIRMSVGIENAKDIWADLDQALNSTETVSEQAQPKIGY